MKFNRISTITLLSLFLFMTITMSCKTNCYADASYTGTTVTSSGVADTGSVFNGYNNVINQYAAEPDWFTGTMSYKIPIVVPPGRGGMQPDLALTYRSNGGNGWLGMGWSLGLDSIERNTRFGVNYGADEYVMRKSDAVSEIISIGDSDYRAKIEGNFNRIVRLTAQDGRTSWEVIDKKGTQYFFGQTTASRQDNPANPNQTFKWCLDQVTDTNGNTMTITYNKYLGEIYLSQISYNGNTINCYLDGTRRDVNEVYTTNFPVKTAYRLKTIDILANGLRQRTYKLNYKDYRGSDSARQDATGRSLLMNVVLYDKNASLDTSSNPTQGDILNESTISKITQFSAQDYSDADANNFTATSALGELTGLGWLDDDYWVYGQGTIHTKAMHITGDFNGDGKTDIMKLEQHIPSWNLGGDNKLVIANGDGTFKVFPPSVDEQNFNLSLDWVNRGVVLAGDFDANSKTDLLLWRPDGANRMLLSNGDGSFVSKQNLPQTISWNSGSTTIQVGDFDGDGKCDVLKWDAGGTISLFLSRNNFALSTLGLSVPWTVGSTNFVPADFNGDGKMDILKVDNSGITGRNVLLLSQGNGTFSQISAPLGIGNSAGWTPGVAKLLLGDFNGDGKTDILKIDISRTSGITILATTSTLFLSRGDGTFTNIDTSLSALHPNGNNTNFIEAQQTYQVSNVIFRAGWVNVAGDFNGDGKTDVLQLPYGSSNNSPGSSKLFLSNGDGTFTTKTIPNSVTNVWQAAILPGDFSGTGKAGFLAWGQTGSSTLNLWGSGLPLDTLTSYKNAIGGSTAIGYKQSTNYTNSKLPFPVKTVSTMTSSDGNGNSSTSEYVYSGGYYHIGDRDFRGFNHVKATGPAGPVGEQQITETFFHQGNDLAVDVNTPGDSPGYMKGKPYRVKTTDQNQSNLSETTMWYVADADGQAPYFNPLDEVATLEEGKYTDTYYKYDNYYGNLLRLIERGDPFDSTDDRTTIIKYSPNTANWIVGLPSSVSVYKGDYQTAPEASIANSLIKSTANYYDGTTGCDTPSTNQTPDKGNVTRQVFWNNNGTSPELRMAYDSYGNLRCRRDANGNTTSFAYDTTNTFLKTVTNPLGQPAITQYYGVDGPADKGLYGQLKSVTDPNGAITTLQYDTFGRKTLALLADGFQSSWAFNDSGNAGTQYAYTGNSAGQWKYSYFDGLGRIFKERKSGPDAKTIRIDTSFDSRGAASQKSLPFFDGVESPRWTRLVYDPRGRVIQVTNPDVTMTKSCFGAWTQAVIDEKGHRKRQSHDAFGRLIKVEEYLGTYSSCTTDVGTPYATTTYQYDVLGNLKFVTDTNGITTEMRYDSLGRKYYMNDPDMGVWNYVYDGNGNLTLQTDAKGQQIKFAYDALDRLKSKDYDADNIIDVTYNYDETAMTNPVGRLTSMSDGSGSTTYDYDSVGRITRKVKTVGGTSYPINYAYSLGRLGSMTYPDNETVAYGYDGGGNLASAGAYAAFAGYNALGQPGSVTYGNGVVTAYQYKPTNNRLSSLIATSPVQGQLINLSYGYDNKGNITSIDGLNDSDIPNYPASTGTSLYPGKAHAIGTTTSGRIFQYDANGNMTSDGQRTFTYTLENMPNAIATSAGTVSFVYDGNAARVKKTSPYGTTLYIDKLYECTNGVCGKYIFAGNSRVALKMAAKTLYYHGDHLGSTVAVTNATGAVKKSIAYYPYGETRSESGTEAVSHRYTAQEYDDETGLYNYNARLYSPELERFVSPDPFVFDAANPQNLNRYSYVMNNPLLYIDPSGYSQLSAGLGVLSTTLGTAAFFAGPALPALKFAGLAVSGVSIINAVFENKLSPHKTMTDFDFNATVGLELANIAGAGAFGLASSRIAKITNAVKRSEYLELTEAFGRVFDTKLWAVGLPMTVKDIMEAFRKEKNSLTALDKHFFQNSAERQQPYWSTSGAIPSYSPQSQGATNPVNYNQIINSIISQNAIIPQFTPNNISWLDVQVIGFDPSSL